MSNLEDPANMQELVVTPFTMHLSDAILAAHLVKFVESRPEIKAMHCRTAVAHAVFALECAANCFIAQLPRNHSFRDQAEAWPLLEKFDLYLLSKPDSPRIPRDKPTVTSVVGLIKLRDKHVHPRSTHLPISSPENPGPSFKITWPWNHVSGIKPASFIWTFEDAVKAINIVLDFLRMILSLAQLSKGQLQMTLKSKIVYPEGSHECDLGNFNILLKVADSIGVDVKFLLND